jgi:hypothetical protein
MKGLRHELFPNVIFPNVKIPNVKIPNRTTNLRKNPEFSEGKGTKLSEGCPKVRLSQDRMTILSFHLACYEGKGTKLGEGERDLEGKGT